MVLILAISCSSKIASNPLTPPPTPSPDETEQELLLQIDGVGMDWSDAQVKAFVEKICATVDRLRTKYKVSVLTNPISYYKEEGHGQGDPSVGVNRVHPNLLSEFRYLHRRISMSTSISALPITIRPRTVSWAICPCRKGVTESPKRSRASIWTWTVSRISLRSTPT